MHFRVPCFLPLLGVKILLLCVILKSWKTKHGLVGKSGSIVFLRILQLPLKSSGSK